jgi:hypothetical protein
MAMTYILQALKGGKWRTVCDSPSRSTLATQAQRLSYPTRIRRARVYGL